MVKSLPRPTEPGAPPSAASGAQQRSLWGRLWHGALAKAERAAPPLAQAPTRRPLTVRDALYTEDARSGRRVYVPLVVEGQSGTWAGREWLHNGNDEGVLVARWVERDHLGAPLRWQPLAHGRVQVIEGGQAQ